VEKKNVDTQTASVTLCFRQLCTCSGGQGAPVMEVLSHMSVGDAVQGSSLTIVVFAARWCLPSQNLVRSFQKIEATLLLNVRVIDVEQDPEIAAKFGVRAFLRQW
jgi:thioredoxin-like negative regulator of GroEL